MRFCSLFPCVFVHFFMCFRNIWKCVFVVIYCAFVELTSPVRLSVCLYVCLSVTRVDHTTRSQAVARIADRTASQQTLVPN